MVRSVTLSAAKAVLLYGLAAALVQGGSGRADDSPTPANQETAASPSGAQDSANARKSGQWRSDYSDASKKQSKHRQRPDVNLKDSAAVAAAADKLILANLAESGTQPAPRTSDEDFLRRVRFDLAGTVPTPSEVTMFGLDPDSQKRLRTIDRLLDSEDYAHNWAEYWRDVIFLRATDMRARLMEGAFEKWMAGEISQNAGWDKITTALITGKGEVTEHGETALIFSHAGQADEVAAETARIFLGIQIQCANCHDHPSDKWKRQQFHQLAAFFPRVNIRREPGQKPPVFEVVSYDDRPARKGKGKGGGLLEHPERLFRLFDRNHDGKITRDEVRGTKFEKPFERLLAIADTNKDGALTLKEIKERPLPGGQKRPTAEHFMPDLKHPESQGTKVEPVFFVDGRRAPSGLSDEQRRHTLAHYITSRSDPWFSRAYVNRIWAEMLGEGFYTPIDDMGPQREARMPEVLDLLADAFVANKYDMKWLFRTIARTEAYQREIRMKDTSAESPPVFAASAPKRLRADQLFNTITKVLGIEGGEPLQSEEITKKNRYARSPRSQFAFLFGYDPSTTQEELIGNVPQALFMMNSGLINGLIHGVGNTRLAHILKEYRNDQDVVREVYVLTLAREPSEKEEKICLDYVKNSPSRRVGFEDVMWSLLNSSEFLSKR